MKTPRAGFRDTTPDERRDAPPPGGDSPTRVGEEQKDWDEVKRLKEQLRRLLERM